MYGILKTTLYYCIINDKNQMVLQDCKLPIYWNKKVADKRCLELGIGSRVVKINAKQFNNLITIGKL
jgi:hypothetical protein